MIIFMEQRNHEERECFRKILKFVKKISESERGSDMIIGISSIIEGEDIDAKEEMAKETSK